LGNVKREKKYKLSFSIRWATIMNTFFLSITDQCLDTLHLLFFQEHINMPSIIGTSGVARTKVRYKHLYLSDIPWVDPSTFHQAAWSTLF
jgi:hypothetical protein